MSKFSHPGNKSQAQDATHPMQRGVFFSWLALIGQVIALGALIGLGTSVALHIADGAQELLWEGIGASLPQPIARLWPLLLCGMGGICIGLWTRTCGFELDTLEEVVAKLKQNGTYTLRSWAKAFVLFVLPIAFGGSVGPEAGISGFAVAGVCAARTDVSNRWQEELEVAKTHSGLFSRVLWACGGAGFVAAVLALRKLIGPAGALPRFEAISYAELELSSLGAALVAVGVGYIAHLVMQASERLFLATRRHAQDADPGQVGSELAHELRDAALCGVALGVVALWLPGVLFSGQLSTFDVMSSWQAMGVGLLILTAVAKLVLTVVCVRCHWIGGEFFPMIYCAVCLGFAIALLLGCDPVLTVVCTTSSLVGAHTQKPALTTVVLLLCFPVSCVVPVLVCALAASKLSQLSLARA